MIANIKELEKYQSDLWLLLGASDINDSLLLKSNIKQELKNDFPFYFSSFICEYNLEGTEIGYFQLGFDNLFEIDKKLLDKLNLIFIGSYPDYTIYVARESPYFKEDQIILIDDEIIGNETNPRPEDIQIVADNIEQFLLIIGNLNQLHREVSDDDSNYDEKRIEFIDRLKKLRVNEKYYGLWKLLF
jgi:hypothetical protein